MRLIVNIFFALIVLGIWLGAIYFYFFYPHASNDMKVGIVVMVVCILLLNAIYCAGLKILTADISKPTKLDYILTLFLGHFGCYRIRKEIMQEALKEQARMRAKLTKNQETEISAHKE